MAKNDPMHPLDRVTMEEMRRMVAPMKGNVTGPSAREMFDQALIGDRNE
jgi:hypothetical protein